MQVRKYTGEPYTNHLRAVADMADGKCNLGYEIGLCHDLFEDTECSYNELLNTLRRFDYEDNDAIFICNRVQDLTDVYTTEAFPYQNRAERKNIEAARLHKIHPDAQTVKYCGLIDNTSSIVKHDKGFAKKYLAEKADILAGMDKGDFKMYVLCQAALTSALNQML